MLRHAQVYMWQDTSTIAKIDNTKSAAKYFGKNNG
jgi:hypothetical protein